MKNCAFLLAALLSAGFAVSANAAGRPYSPDMTCKSLQGLMANRGAAVISTGPMTYDRFVSDSRFCEPSEVTRAEWIPSVDQKDCFIGYSCYERQRGNNY